MKNILPKLDLNITNRCNFRCTHCAFNSGKLRMPEMSLNNIEKILRETRELGGQRFDITGGESTLRKDVPEIIKLGKDLGYKIELVSNGSLLTLDRLRLLKSQGLDSIAVSLDGSNYESYYRIRKVGEQTYQDVLKNIRNSISLGIKTKINTVVFSSNLEDITNITDWCLRENVSEHGLYYFTPVGRGQSSVEKSVEPLQWLNFVRTSLVKYLNVPMKISLELPLLEKEYWSPELGCIGCGQRKGHLQVLPDGNVYPCAILASYKKPLANIYKIGVKELWENQVLWNNYWKDISKQWRSNGGFCVDLRSVFSGKSPDSEKYRYVCPLRKFNLQEVPCLENLSL